MKNSLDYKKCKTNELMENINLIRSIAWTFYKGSWGIEWDDLFSEACLAYLQAVQIYNPNNGKKSSLAYICIKNALGNFCKKHNTFRPKKHIDWYDGIVETPEYDFERTFRSFPRSDEFKAFSQDTKAIINMVVRDPLDYAMPPKKVIIKIRKTLKEQEWYPYRIEKAMKKLKEDLRVTS